MYGCESQTVKAELWRIDAFQLCCWRWFLRVLWTSRRSNQSTLKEINPEWIFTERTDAETDIPILWSSDAKNQLTGKDPNAGKDWRWEKGMTEDEMVGWPHWLGGHGLSKLQEIVEDRRAWRAAVPGVSESDTAKTLKNSHSCCKLSCQLGCLKLSCCFGGY